MSTRVRRARCTSEKQCVEKVEAKIGKVMKCADFVSNDKASSYVAGESY